MPNYEIQGKFYNDQGIEIPRSQAGFVTGVSSLAEITRLNQKYQSMGIDPTLDARSLSNLESDYNNRIADQLRSGGLSNIEEADIARVASGTPISQVIQEKNASASPNNKRPGETLQDYNARIRSQTLANPDYQQQSASGQGGQTGTQPTQGQTGTQYNLGNTTTTQYQTGTISSGQNLSTIVRNLGITPQQFLALNPEFKATGRANDWQGLTGLVRPGQTYKIPGQNQVLGTSATAPAVSPIGSGTPSPITPPTLPQGGDQTNVYFQSLAQQLATSQQQYDTFFQQQLQQLQSDKAAAQAELENIRQQQAQNISAQGAASLEEKQMILDRLAQEEARFNEQYTIAQGLQTKLTDLMTEGNNLIGMISGKTGLQGIRNPRINQAIQGVTAAVGVVQAGLSAANDQMGQAKSQLKLATDTIVTAFDDQMDYYRTLNNFYESQATDTANKLTVLTRDERDYLDQQLDNLARERNRIQANSDYIQKLMVNPTTALFMAQAGITLMDSPEQINQKMAMQAQRDEVKDTTNEYVKDGYTPSAVPTANTIAIESGGQTLYFKKPPEKTKTSTTINLTRTEQKKLDAYLGEIASYADKQSALDDLQANKFDIIQDIGQNGYDRLVQEVNNTFKETSSTKAIAPVSTTSSGKRRGIDIIREEGFKSYTTALGNFLFNGNKAYAND